MAIKSRLVFLVACALLLISLAQWVVGEDGHPAKKGNPVSYQVGLSPGHIFEMLTKVGDR